MSSCSSGNDSTYSLLQVSLDQTIDRESLEEASVVVPSVARADCAHLQRDLFGIVISNLPLEEAKAFQAELKLRGLPTDMVADHELPVLHDPFTIQKIISQKLRGGNPLAFPPAHPPGVDQGSDLLIHRQPHC